MAQQHRRQVGVILESAYLDGLTDHTIVADRIEADLAARHKVERA